MKPNHWVFACLFFAPCMFVFAEEDGAEKADLEKAKWDVSAPPLSVEPVSATLDTREGTWMSLDVSPDGKFVAFDLLGDIYQVPIGGGAASNLTRGHAWDIQPRYSPDGTTLAFTSDRGGGDNIWLMNLATTELSQLTNESFRLLNNPSWSPDGQFIAARKHFTTSRSLGTGEIWLYHTGSKAGVDGEPPKYSGVPVIERSGPAFQKELGEPAYSADGKSIFYTQNTTPGNTFIYHQDSNQEVFQIRQVELSTGEVTTAAGGPGGAVRPTPSPDGQKLAYVKRVRAASRLFVKDLASGVSTMVVDDLDPDMQETWAVHGLYPNMDWTPDSREVVFWAGGGLWRVDVSTKARTNIPFHVTDKRDIYPAPRFPIEVAPEKFQTRMVRFAARSPDAKLVVFESLGELYVKQGESAPKKLTTDSAAGFEFFPVFSPDSKQVYFVRWTDDGLASIRVVRSRGGKSKAVYEEKGQYAELAVSPDGKRLTFRKLAGSSLLHPEWGQAPGIYVLDTGSGKAKFVSKRGRQPVFSGNDRITALERKRPEGRGSDLAKTVLFDMSLAGDDVREIAKGELVTDIRLAPGGDYIAFVENHHIYVMPYVRTGKPATLGRKEKGLPVHKASEVGGTFMHWSADGVVNWSTGPDLMSVGVDDQGLSEARTTALGMLVAAAAPTGDVALQGARIITMDATRSVIEDGVLVVRGNRIVAVGARGEIDIPENAKTVDLAGRTVIPGLIDIHAHGPYAAGQIIPQQNWNALAHLALGLTTLHNPSSRAYQAFVAAEYAQAGRILSPRIFSTGEIVYGAQSTSFSPVDSLEEARAHVKRLKAQGAYSIKNYNQPRREQRQQVIEAARLEGLMTVAEGASLFHQDMNLIADGTTGIEHNVPVMRMYDDVTQLWRQSESGYTPTLVVTFGGLTSEDYYYQQSDVWKHPILSNFVPPTVLQPRAVRRPMAPDEDYRDDDAAAAALVLLEAGVSVNTGGHGQREGLATHWEMWSFVRGGMSPMQALSAATINPAGYLGMEADIGSLEPGKLADLVILEGNPLADIHNSDNVTEVMLNGRLYRADTLSEVVTGSKKLKPFWWQGRAEYNIR